MKKMLKKIKKAFSLVEMTITIAIIGVIVGIALPSFGRVLENANKTSMSKAIVSSYEAIQQQNIVVEGLSYTNGVFIAKDTTSAVVYYAIMENGRLLETNSYREKIKVGTNADSYYSLTMCAQGTEAYVDSDGVLMVYCDKDVDNYPFEKTTTTTQATHIISGDTDDIGNAVNGGILSGMARKVDSNGNVTMSVKFIDTGSSVIKTVRFYDGVTPFSDSIAAHPGHTYVNGICTSCGNGIILRLSGSGTTYAVASIGSYNGNSLTISSKYDGIPVTSIDAGAFANAYNLKSITIPNTITSIGDRAFEGCVGLTSFVVPETVSSIGKDAFANSGLTQISVNSPNGWTATSSNNSESTAVALNDSTQNVEKFLSSYRSYYWSRESQGLAFGETASGYKVKGIGSCTDTNIIIPSSYNGKAVMSISSSAFQNNTSITSVTLPESLYFIDHSAFLGCTNLENVIVEGHDDGWYTWDPKNVYVKSDDPLAFANYLKNSIWQMSDGLVVGNTIHNGVTYQRGRNDYYYSVVDVACTNYDNADVWWDSATGWVTFNSGPFIGFRWENTRDTNFAQDVVYEFNTGSKYFDAHALRITNPNPWTVNGFSIGNYITERTINGEVVNSFSAEGDSANGYYGGVYTTTFVRSGKIMIIEETLNSVSGDVLKMKTVFDNFETGSLQIRLAGNPYFADNIQAFNGNCAADTIMATGFVDNGTLYEKKNLQRVEIVNNDSTNTVWWDGSTTDFDVPEGDFTLVYKWYSYSKYAAEAVYEFNTSSGIYFDMSGLQHNPWSFPENSFQMGEYTYTALKDGAEYDTTNLYLSSGTWYTTTTIIRSGRNLIVYEICTNNSTTYQVTTRFNDFTTESLKARINGIPAGCDRIEAFLSETAIVDSLTMSDSVIETSTFTKTDLKPIDIVNDDIEGWWNGSTSAVNVPTGDFSLVFTFDRVKDTSSYFEVVYEIQKDSFYFDKNVLSDNVWTAPAEDISLYPKTRLSRTLNGVEVGAFTDKSGFYEGTYIVSIFRVDNVLYFDEVLTTVSGNVLNYKYKVKNFKTDDVLIRLTGDPSKIGNIRAYLGGVEVH